MVKPNVKNVEFTLDGSHLRRNTPALYIGFGLLFAAVFAAEQLQHTLPEHVTLLVALIGLSMPLLAIGLFELRSGYTWRNLSAGNRGVSRSEHPARFLISVTFHLLVAFTIIGYALWQFVAKQ